MLDFLFPRVCHGCETVLYPEENVLCLYCLSKLPILAHHRYQDKQMELFFYGRLRLKYATSLVRFEKKGLTQRLLHKLKYHGKQQIGAFFGKWMGSELACTHLYNQIDLVVPVPLHPKKLRKRGYNQVERFAQEIAGQLRAAYEPTILKREGRRTSQVFRSRSARMLDETTFHVRDGAHLEGKHVLLVDDIITTGMTLELCGKELLKLNPSSLSLVTIAIAS
ncbi:ComF family protein [Aureitalea marina]|uniref:Phosphoribosyltransferase domain-containing protein n=1 Tax=Aureitalea marina TaxID=930804 RepID=A0A2S7KSP1_9FLAO|nr:phosphoribosyltransferase family protein [Aureitalea marina]PQB05649.1 hypothetical protein BST85_12640 [Aureitalea marina]